jgi:hypothetical protein
MILGGDQWFHLPGHIGGTDQDALDPFVLDDLSSNTSFVQQAIG